MSTVVQKIHSLRARAAQKLPITQEADLEQWQAATKSRIDQKLSDLDKDVERRLQDEDLNNVPDYILNPKKELIWLFPLPTKFHELDMSKHFRHLQDYIRQGLGTDESVIRVSNELVFRDMMTQISFLNQKNHVVEPANTRSIEETVIPAKHDQLSYAEMARRSVQ